MLSVLVFETLSDKVPRTSEILYSGVEMQSLPVKRLKRAHSFDSFVEELGDDKKFNTIILSLNEVEEEHINLAMRLRAERRVLFIVFVLRNPSDVSVVARPSIQVSGILFSPVKREVLNKTIWEVYSEYMRIFQGSQSRFVVKNGTEQVFISTDEICFFEAKAKKIALKTMSQEISFYSNFDAVMQQLPDGFVRCHKGFVVNIHHVRSANWRDMSLFLTDGSTIPVSRGYKQTLLETLPRTESV